MNGDSYAARGKDSGRSRDHYGAARSDREDRKERGDRSSRGDRGDRRERERRRSRSPQHGSRSGRREQEPDLYSSSRDYRAREREDRYSGRRDEREWDRDRGERRRDHRREDDDRSSRRDRDLPDERSRGGRGRDRDAFGGGRERKRSASPPPKKREPTPDLTDVIPILERKRRLTQWDIKPPGYEHVTAEQAKLSGMFPLPGAPRQQAVDPSRLQAFIHPPTTTTPGTSTNTVLKPSNSRQAKRLFVHNLPTSATEESLVQFFNLQLNGLNVIKGIDPCVSAQLSKDKSFALLEFRSAADTTVALAFDGITMEDSGDMDTSNGDANGSNQGLSIRRPKDYILPSVVEEEPHQEGVVSNVVPDSPNKICVSNIPPFIEEEPVTMLLVSFGELKSFVLVKDSETGESRGIAFCEYLDPMSTDIAVENLNGMELGNKRLKVVRASIGTTQAAGLDMGVNAMSMYAKTTSQDIEAGRVLQLLNMVTTEELLDTDDYEEICDDVRDECSKYGEVVELKVPRPTGNNKQSAGVGKIYVKFDNSESATKALKALAGRKFQDRTVVTTYFSEENFEVNAW
ncbi:splicing factor U2AF 65 kDa subunit [[Emmonsia] crescens]|uniref:Splicing factor U2AF subunit n=1 Tax=[Emmonsia] crescens TaxID=73230 RepID=A0A2B7ZEV3_9EURO|nr:splicing factor U2AF 65 kDa subunit [Emmonsia crescens]